MNTIIIVTRRSKDFHACIDGQVDMWSSGKTANEAIGNLIRQYPALFKIYIEYT